MKSLICLLNLRRGTPFCQSRQMTFERTKPLISDPQCRSLTANLLAVSAWLLMTSSMTFMPGTCCSMASCNVYTKCHGMCNTMISKPCALCVTTPAFACVHRMPLRLDRKYKHKSAKACNIRGKQKQDRPTRERLTATAKAKTQGGTGSQKIPRVIQDQQVLTECS